MKYLALISIFIVVFQIKAQTRLSKATNNREIKEAFVSKKDSLKYFEVLNYVNPFIGTGGHGHTFPGASAPFGFMQLSPDTRLNGWDGCSGYHYSDTEIYGFSHTHLSGTGVEDYCDILFTPMLSNGENTQLDLDSKSEKRRSFSYSHANETASPGYYKVKLDNGIEAQFTVSKRAGIHRYTFPKSTDKKYILVDLTHRDQLLYSHVKQIDPNKFSGTRVSRSWAKNQHISFYFQSSIVPLSTTISKDQTKLLLEFDGSNESVEIRIAISGVDENGAIANFDAELKDKTFEQLLERVRIDWRRELAAVTVDKSDKNLATIFYSALYHSYLAPNIFNDVDGRYRGLDQEIHSDLEKKEQYTVFSLWDTYRATHPWFTLFQTKRTTDFISTFTNQFNQSGALPVWELSANETYCMIGFHAASVIADAYVKGITKFDVDNIILALEKTAHLDNFGKPMFNKNGYIDYKLEPESVSKNLEYAYDSYCVYLFLKEAKKNGFKVEDSTIELYHKRSFNFINSFDPSTGFMRAKTGGLWNPNFMPEEVNFHYTEANSWQYSLYAPHAIPVLANLVGGIDGMEKWLDKLFTSTSVLKGNHQLDITGLIGQYAHGNEPSHHMAYLYNYTNSPEKTAAIVDSILYHYYSNEPDGLSGNEDCGQMSSWFTFSALGFYPVSPGSPIYDFGRPIFSSAMLQFENGNRIHISSINNSKNNKYIQSIKLDGKSYTKRFISHEDLINSKNLEFKMGPFPSAEYRSYSIAPSEEEIAIDFVPLPYFHNAEQIFTEKLSIEIKSVDDNLSYFYSLDGSEPSLNSKKYKKPIKIKESTTIKVFSYNAKTQKSSAIITNTFNKKDSELTLTLSTPYKAQYAASGADALIDKQFGGREFRSGDWQGFYNVDANGILTFSTAKPLTKIGLSALQSTRSWIFPPKEVVFKISYSDNSVEQFSVPIKEIPNNVDAPEVPINFEMALSGKPVRSVEFTAFNFGKNPEWHQSPGFETFIFLDELYFE